MQNLTGATALLWIALHGAPDWAEVTGPPEGTWPEEQAAVVWRDDLNKALAEARREDRPLFVTARCLPCKQCSEFDRDVLEGGPELDPLLSRFVTVRLTDAAQLDLRLFDLERFQDLDLSWWGWFLSPEGATYGVFGGRDGVSDTTRISVPALAATLARVLDHHADPRRKSWNIDGPVPDLSEPQRGPRDLPGYRSWRTKLPENEASSCLHCHQVADILRQPAIDAGRYDKGRNLNVWPLPENVGLTLDRDDGLCVTDVAPDSPAARAGLRKGDVLVAADGRRVFSQTDVRAALHRAADPSGKLELVARRPRGEDHLGFLVQTRFELTPGWRATDLAWRMSASQGNVGAAPGFGWPHAGPRNAALTPGGMSIRPWFGPRAAQSVAWQAGLRPSHTIVAVRRAGESSREQEATPEASPDLSARAFLVWFRQRFDPGDRVALTVREGSELRTIEYTLPESRPE